jgi:hypothetical protein
MELLPGKPSLAVVARQPALHVEAAVRLMSSVKQSGTAKKNYGQFPKALIWDWDAAIRWRSPR